MSDRFEQHYQPPEVALGPPETTAYTEYLLALIPPALSGPQARVYLESHGEVLDRLLTRLLLAVRVHLIHKAPEEALALLGEERSLPRLMGEDVETYRRRVLGAWEFWQWAGTLEGVVRALAVMGYRTRVIEHYRSEPERWAEFSLALSDASERLYWLWDSGERWDGGASWGSWGEAAVLPVVNTVKPAHARLRRVIWVHPNGFAWDDGSRWGDSIRYDLANRSY